jgi:hypothetical protein
MPRTARDADIEPPTGPVVSATRARQGQRLGHVLGILVVSLALLVAAYALMVSTSAEPSAARDAARIEAADEAAVAPSRPDEPTNANGYAPEQAAGQ